MHVVGFKIAVCRQFSVACAVRPQIREQRIVAVPHEQLGIAEHSSSVVGLAVQQDHRASSGLCGVEKPAAHLETVRGGDLDVFRRREVPAPENERLTRKAKRDFPQVDGRSHDSAGGEKQCPTEAPRGAANHGCSRLSGGLPVRARSLGAASKGGCSHDLLPHIANSDTSVILVGTFRSRVCEYFLALQSLYLEPLRWPNLPRDLPASRE